MLACRLVVASLACLALVTAKALDQSDGMLGVLTPLLEMELEPVIEGRVIRVVVRIGDRVEKGGLIAELDSGLIRRDLAEAEARLQAALAGEAEAETKLRMARGLLERQRTLVEKQAISRESVRAAQEGVELSIAELDRATAEVRHYEATAAHHRERLGETRLLAPFSGTIAERYANPGMTVGPDRAVVRLISNEMLRVRFAAPIERAGELMREQRLRLIVSGIGQALDGEITQVGSEVDPASGMIICEGTVSPPARWHGPPLSGQPVRVWIEGAATR